MKYQFANGVSFDTEAELKAYLLGLQKGAAAGQTEKTAAELDEHVQDIQSVLSAQGWTGWPVTNGSEVEGDATEAEKAEAGVASEGEKAAA